MPGLREYETITILAPEIPDETVDRVNGRVVNVLAKMEAKILRMDNWGKRKLAFEVNKQIKGIYLYFLYLGKPGTVEELERNLKMWDDVIRFQTVKVDEDVNPDARPAEITEEELRAVEEAAMRPAPEIFPPSYGKAAAVVAEVRREEEEHAPEQQHDEVAATEEPAEPGENEQREDEENKEEE